ncbi:MAG TPA: tripartite tricarboxylate transporter substrate-binding protein [Xanthobacteraceae bacterium]|jgi:tripartite-type tricarboxylate transporter receptor subunit TctC|nr:tripartite tricarboxylate transporter substrate-binding protein [Xanthobacteraceae bacterium]
MRAACSLAGALTALALSPLAASAQDNERAFFAGRTVHLVVGYGPGGGYDTYARMLAPHLSKMLGASVVVENQPGAGGLVALNRLATTSADGLTMMIVNGTGAALSQLTGQPGVRFDLGQFGYLGTVAASPWMWLVGPASAIRTPQDAMKLGKKINWAAGGPADGLSDGAAFTCEALALDCHVVLGYAGSNQAALAVTQGEMDAIYVSDTSASNYAMSGQLHAVAAMGRVRSRFFPDTETIFEALPLTADQQWLFEFRAKLEDLGRILLVPANMAQGRLTYLQGAVKATLTAPELVAEGEKSQRYINYLDADTTYRNARDVVSNITPEQRKRVQDILAKAR